MNQSWKDYRKKKTLFRSYYCVGCKQTKPCRKLDQSFCCPCQYQTELEKAREYSNYQQVYQQKLLVSKANYQQYQLLKSYQGCKQCGSLEVDAYYLYEENKLICQPCRMKKEGSASGVISFLEQQKWYKKWWGINLKECLENYECLPVNANCARKWLKDSNRLDSCQCLEIEAQQHYSLINDNLRRSRGKLKECQCVKSEKVRVNDDNYAWCERCETSILAASKKRIIKNRNSPSLWGLAVKEKILCGNCLASKKENMPSLRKAEFNRYRKVKRL